MIELTGPQIAIFESYQPRNIFHCGQGSGKTTDMGYISAFFISNCPNATGLIAANTYGQLSDSTLLRVFEVWENQFGWKKDEHYVFDKEPPKHFKPHGKIFKSNKNKIFMINGCVILTRSLDNYKMIEGVEIGWALLDETKDTKEAAIKDVVTARLREPTIAILKPESNYSRFRFVDPGHKDAQKNVNPLFVFTSPSKEVWLSEYFKFENHRSGIESIIGSHEDFFHYQDEIYNIVVGSAYNNNHNLPEGYLELRELELSKDRIDLNIHGSPFAKSGVEYYGTYKRSIHVKPVYYDDQLPLHLTWDFNAHPYMTGLVGQIAIGDDNRTKLRFFKEYPLKAPRNNIESVCSAFLKDYEPNLGLFCYGDSSGKNTLPIAQFRSFYQVIEQCFIWVSMKLRLLKANPRHNSKDSGSIGRRDFMGKLFAGTLGVDVEIDPSCKELIKDLEFVKEDANGAKVKKKVKKEGVSFEEFGHFSDALDGMACWLFGDWNKV